MVSIFRKFRNNIIRRFSAPLCTFLSIHKLEGMTAFLLRFHMECIQREDKESDLRDIHAIILPKAGFTEDAIATMAGDFRFRINALDRRLVKAAFLAYLPREIDDNNYVSDDPAIDEKKKELRTFWFNVLSRLKLMEKIDVILTGNYTYAAEQEFAAACKEVGIPFIAIHKECLKTPALEDFYQKKYQARTQPFQGSKICVYNEIEKGIQERAGVAPSERIIVTGMPRLDRVHSLREKMSGGDKGSKNVRPYIIFFSFSEKTGLPHIGRKTEEYLEKLDDELDQLSWERLVEDSHMAMFKLAQQEPGLDVVIKTKGDSTAKRIMAKYCGKLMKLPKNMKIVTGGDPLKLIAGCDVVCGFNTTALIESVAMGKPIVVPRFDGVVTEDLAPYIVDLEDAAYYARSQNEMMDLLKRICLGLEETKISTQLDDKTKHILNRWTGNTDGLAGQRVRAVIEQVVEENRR